MEDDIEVDIEQLNDAGWELYKKMVDKLACNCVYCRFAMGLKNEMDEKTHNHVISCECELTGNKYKTVNSDVLKPDDCELKFNQVS